MSGFRPGEEGDAPRFVVQPVVRPTFRVRFAYNGTECGDETDGYAPNPVRRCAVRTFLSKVSAYRWLARRLIFVRRDEVCGGDSEPDREDGSCRCRYHDDRSFRRLTLRLARWLMWRDQRREELARG